MPIRKTFLFICILVTAFLLAVYFFINLAGKIYCQNDINSKIFSFGGKGKIAKADFPFKPGELIEYEVRLNRFKIGKASLSYNGIAARGDVKAVSIYFLSDVANFRDQEKIYADADMFNPLWVMREIDFFSGREFISEDYTLKPNSVTITKYKKKRVVSAKEMVSDIPFQHAIASIYYCRKIKDFAVGKKFDLNLPLAKLQLQVRDIKDIRVPAGKFKAFYIESIPNKYRFWLSADARRIPLKVEGVISFAPAGLVMTKYKEGF